MRVYGVNNSDASFTEHYMVDSTAKAPRHELTTLHFQGRPTHAIIVEEPHSWAAGYGKAVGAEGANFEPFALRDKVISKNRFTPSIMLPSVSPSYKVVSYNSRD